MFGKKKKKQPPGQPIQPASVGLVSMPDLGGPALPADSGGRLRAPSSSAASSKTSGSHGHGQGRLRAPSSSAAALALRATLGNVSIRDYRAASLVGDENSADSSCPVKSSKQPVKERESNSQGSGLTRFISDRFSIGRGSSGAAVPPRESRRTDKYGSATEPSQPPPSSERPAAGSEPVAGRKKMGFVSRMALKAEKKVIKTAVSSDLGKRALRAYCNQETFALIDALKGLVDSDPAAGTHASGPPTRQAQHMRANVSPRRPTGNTPRSCRRPCHLVPACPRVRAEKGAGQHKVDTILRLGGKVALMFQHKMLTPNQFRPIVSLIDDLCYEVVRKFDVTRLPPHNDPLDEAHRRMVGMFRDLESQFTEMIRPHSSPKTHVREASPLGLRACANLSPKVPRTPLLRPAPGFIQRAQCTMDRAFLRRATHTATFETWEDLTPLPLCAGDGSCGAQLLRRGNY